VCVCCSLLASLLLQLSHKVGTFAFSERERENGKRTVEDVQLFALLNVTIRTTEDALQW
jgi:hypothetical protein